MTTTRYSRCKVCGWRKADGAELSTKGTCIVCAVDNATENARAIHPGRRQEQARRAELIRAGGYPLAPGGGS